MQRLLMWFVISVLGVCLILPGLASSREHARLSGMAGGWIKCLPYPPANPKTCPVDNIYKDDGGSYYTAGDVGDPCVKCVALPGHSGQRCQWVDYDICCAYYQSITCPSKNGTVEPTGGGEFEYGCNVNNPGTAAGKGCGGLNQCHDTSS